MLYSMPVLFNKCQAYEVIYSKNLESLAVTLWLERDSSEYGGIEGVQEGVEGVQE